MSSSPTQPPAAPDRTRQFLRLLAGCEQELSGYILALVPTWADADEVAQETKVRLWEQFDEYDPAKDFAAWARTIAYYQVLTHRKQSQRQAAQLSDQFLQYVADEVASLEASGDRRKWALELCLEKLSEPHRQLLAHVYDGGHTIKQVAQRLGRSVRGTQQTVARLRDNLQHCIEQTMRQEEQL